MRAQIKTRPTSWGSKNQKSHCKRGASNYSLNYASYAPGPGLQPVGGKRRGTARRQLPAGCVCVCVYACIHTYTPYDT